MEQKKEKRVFWQPLKDGDTAEIDVVAPVSEDMWWIDESIRNAPPIIDTMIKWRPVSATTRRKS